MNRATLLQMWDHMRMCHGIALRALEQIPADKIDSNPVPKMRTVKQLMVHTYGMVWQECSEGALRGEIRKIDEQTISERIQTREELVRYCRECWEAADRAARAMTDERLQAIVKTPWRGVSIPGHVVFGMVHDEVLHHRGQLYTFVRALGGEPPSMWDFEHNAPEFQPGAAATA